jgi:hypothetical protein
MPASRLPAPWVLGGVLPSNMSAGGILINVDKAFHQDREETLHRSHPSRCVLQPYVTEIKQQGAEPGELTPGRAPDVGAVVGE